MVIIFRRTIRFPGLEWRTDNSGPECCGSAPLCASVCVRLLQPNIAMLQICSVYRSWSRDRLSDETVLTGIIIRHNRDDDVVPSPTRPVDSFLQLLRRCSALTDSSSRTGTKPVRLVRSVRTVFPAAHHKERLL